MVVAALAGAAAALAFAGPGAAGAHRHARPAAATVWLCRPGLAGDPCTADLATTVVPAQGARTTQAPTPAPSPKADCFYVYPTVSDETSTNTDLRIQPAERAVAVAQASRFSTVCRVWAPMYRQETLAGLLSGGAASGRAQTVAYESLLGAWKDYLAHDNAGRPIVFIGHSQGAALLIRLLAAQVDPDAALRRRLVAAIILGGNVTVAPGKTTGGSFRSIPACTSTTSSGCVIAYSSFPSTPPATSLFGRPGQGVSLLAGQTATGGVQVMCVNPGRIGSSGTVPLSPFSPVGDAGAIPPPRVTTPWVAFPGLYTAQCRHSGSATWLQVRASGASRDRRPRLTETAGPDWGFHQADVNLALGNLVADVAAAESAYGHAHR